MSFSRLDLLRSGLSKEMTGVEIGPFYAPVLPKRDGWRSIVVDFCDTAELLERARTHSAESVRERQDQIEEVDVVWDGSPLDELCVPVAGGQVDYVLASHVIEHTPNLIGFLQQCSRMLKPSGVISLAVPDMRKCFDLLKTPSATREVLTAHREARTKHTPETLFEARAYAVRRGDQSAWLAGTTAPLALLSPFDHATSLYTSEAADMDGISYIDAHAWHFTPASFQLIMLELAAMDFTDFQIDSLTDTPGSEFIVRLIRGTTTLAPLDFQAKRLDLALSRYREFLAELPEAYQ